LFLLAPIFNFKPSNMNNNKSTWRYIFWASICMIVIGTIWSTVIYFQYWEILRTPKQQLIQGWKPLLVILVGFILMNIGNYKSR